MAGEQLSSGQIFENAVAIQLKNLGTTQYYQKKTGQDIDFIFNGGIALEDKETPTVQDLKVIEARASDLGINKFYLLGRNLPAGSFSNFIWGGNIL